MAFCARKLLVRGLHCLQWPHRQKNTPAAFVHRGIRIWIRNVSQFRYIGIGFSLERGARWRSGSENVPPSDGRVKVEVEAGAESPRLPVNGEFLLGREMKESAIPLIQPKA